MGWKGDPDFLQWLGLATEGNTRYLHWTPGAECIAKNFPLPWLESACYARRNDGFPDLFSSYAQ